jgi:hypothetical protein
LCFLNVESAWLCSQVVTREEPILKSGWLRAGVSILPAPISIAGIGQVDSVKECFAKVGCERLQLTTDRVAQGVKIHDLLIKVAHDNIWWSFGTDLSRRR